MTGSGRYFDPLNPTPESVHMPDVARGLMNIRFNGQLRDPADCPDSRTIASHSMRVGRLAWWRLSDDVNIDNVTAKDATLTVLAALIHDAPEGYCQDRVRPLKTDRDRKIEATVMTATSVHLVGVEMSIPLVGAVGSDVVRWADDIALAQEAMLFQCGAEDWTDHARMNVAETLHLFWPREGEYWETAVIVVTNMVNSDGPIVWAKLGDAIGIGRP